MTSVSSNDSISREPVLRNYLADLEIDKTGIVVERMLNMKRNIIKCFLKGKNNCIAKYLNNIFAFSVIRTIFYTHANLILLFHFTCVFKISSCFR